MPIGQYDDLTPEERAEQRFQEAAERQRRYELRGEARYGHLFASGEDYILRGRRTTQWVVEGLLPAGYLAILGATSKAGKTCFATALAMAVAKGQPFLGMPVLPGAVLWCAYEESEAERLQILREWPEHPYRFYITHDKPLIDDPEGLDAIAYWIYKTEAKLVVIDPLYGATAADSLTDGRVARRVLMGLKELCRKHQCTALVLHHITKDLSAGMVRERFADSNQILATASMDMLMDATDLPDGARLLRIACRGRGQSSNQTFFVRSSGVTRYDREPAPVADLPHGNPVDGRILAHLSESPRPLTSADIAGKLNLPPQSVRNRLTRLVGEGCLATVGKEGRAFLYTPQRARDDHHPYKHPTA